MKTTVGRNVALVSGIICIILTASLVGAIANYTSIINAKDNTITSKDSAINDLNSQITNKNAQLNENNNTIASLNSQISNKDSQISNQNSQIQALTSQNDQLQTWLNGNLTALNAQIANLQSQASLDNSTIANLQGQVASANSQIVTLQTQAASDQFTITNLQEQVTSANSQINSLTSTVTTLQSQVNDLTAIINMSKTQLQTLIFHVCEKGEGYTWGRIPDVNGTYNQILAVNNNTYNIVLLPEYKGNENWTEELSWLTANFGGPQGIPIMLSVFEGGPYADHVVTQLTTAQISDAMAVCNVRGIRIFEVVSWYIEHNLPFPAEYITNILTFCRANNLAVFWSEWKVGDNVFQSIQSYIAGFEDIVTVSFSTNSGDLEPAEGFMLVSQMFPHWGGSVQAWYWETRHRGNYSTVPENPPGISNPLNMPISLLIEHALSAKNAGAEILQFEPYWYFFDNDGKPNENLKLLEIMLTS
jgi:peptidoglycan hydrolase CwlO-like protein